MAITPTQALNAPSSDAVHVDTFVEYLESAIDTAMLKGQTEDFWKNTDFKMVSRVSVDCPNSCISYVHNAMVQIELAYKAVGWNYITAMTSDVYTAEKEGTDFVLTIILS